MASRRRTWFLVRIAVYVAVIAVLSVTRGGLPWHRLKAALTGGARPTGTLTVAGCDLAPRLADRLLAAYRREYPDLTLERRGGGTNQALEDLLNGGADVALLDHPPSAREQGYFRSADGDTAVVVPVALGAALLLVEGSAPIDAPALADLAAALDGRRPGLFPRLYATDPNDGLWDVVLARLDLAGPDPAPGVPVVFLADPAAVETAVRNDPGAWGLVGSLAAPGDPWSGPPAGLAYVPLRAAPDSAAVAPAFATLVTGAYPLHHRLYAACRGGGGIEGAKFITWLASGPGQRQVERAGEVPDRHMARLIQLSRNPVGR